MFEVYTDNEGPDQPVLHLSLIRAYDVHLQNSVILKVLIIIAIGDILTFFFFFLKKIKAFLSLGAQR